MVEQGKTGMSVESSGSDIHGSWRRRSWQDVLGNRIRGSHTGTVLLFQWSSELAPRRTGWQGTGVAEMRCIEFFPESTLTVLAHP